MSSTNTTGLTAAGGNTVCTSSGPASGAQFIVGSGFAVNLTFPGTPPYRFTASVKRDSSIRCPTHTQNLTTNTYTWVIETSTNSTRLNQSSGDLGFFRNSTPVFQLGDAVQWAAIEWAPQPDGQVRYFRSANYTITSEERSIAQQTPQSGGLRVAQAGVCGWLVAALLVSGVAVMSV